MSGEFIPQKPVATQTIHAEDPEMQQWAFEASSAIEAADKATKNTLERYREAGEALAKAKKKGGHGKWMAWLKRHGIAPRTAGRAIKIASMWTKLANLANLTEAFKVMADAPEETEKAKPVEIAPLCKRCQNVGPTTNCKGCEEAEIEWKASRKGGKSKPKEEGEEEEREAGDDSKQIEEDKRKEPEAKKKQGQPVFELTGKFTRLADQLGKVAGKKEDPEYQELRDLIAKVHDTFAKLYERDTKQKVPN
jgi:hypothetical protein